jgi:hypothetical protein
MAAPEVPDVETREKLLAVLADFVAQNGAEPLLRAPVVPGPKAFPEPWAPSRAGVALLLRRLATYAELDRTIILDDQRFAKAPPTERKPATRVEFRQLTKDELRFALGYVGSDDVVGTLAHEIGVAYAALHRPSTAEPYRSVAAETVDVDTDRDQPRGSVATVYLGLGVVAANAAYQQYSRDGRFNGAFVPLEYDVLEAGYVRMSALAYLLAVQAIVQQRDAPAALSGPQRDEVVEWMRALRDARGELCERLGIAPDARALERAPIAAFTDARLDADSESLVRKTAFRWRTHRGGVGFIAGTVLGVGIAASVASRGVAPLFAFGGAAVGHLAGRRVRVPRCSACATVVVPTATVCRACGAALRGDIGSLAERLEAEERLEPSADESPPIE